MPRPDDFSLKALYAALDAQRQARGLSWTQATREISRQVERPGIHQLSRSTVVGTRTRAVAEADGVLQMLLWLGCSPESFVPGDPGSSQRTARLPEVPAHHVLRLDTRKLYAALDELRIERELSWADVARDVALSVSQLSHLARGGRTSFPQVMRLVRWLGRPLVEFTRIADG